MAPEHIFVDTNVFLRYLTNDVPEQADAVDLLLQRAEAGEVHLETSPLVIAEIVWTLESFYCLDRPAVAEKILAVVNTPGLEVADAHLVLQACAWYVEARIDFNDAWNAAWMLDRGVGVVATFDRAPFRRIEGLAVKSPDEAGLCPTAG